MSYKLNKIGTKIENYAESFQRILYKNIKGKKVDENLQLIFITILIRNIDSIFSISKLFQNTKIEHSYFSIASILRGNILNGITALYLANKIESGKIDSEQKLIRKEIEKIHIDQIRFLLNDIKFLIDNGSKKNTTKIITSLNKDYSYYLQEPIKNLNNIKGIKFIHEVNGKEFTSKNMVLNSRNKQIALRLYDRYMYFSKLEHIGLITHKFHTRIYNNKDEEILTVLNTIKDLVLINEIFKSFGDFDIESNKVISKISKKINLDLEN